ncbi:MAG: hypothetical protein JXQ75_07515 [Phycisphaerae bacterium]|nr:hypothetical protein [Phycisphaerae bacterium]
MSIVVQCQACRKRVHAPDRLAGKRAMCKCGAVLAIPSPQPVDDLLDASLVDEIESGELPNAATGPTKAKHRTESAEAKDTTRPSKAKEIDEATLIARQREAMREGLATAVPSMITSLVIGAVLLVAVVYLMRSPVSAAHEVLVAGGDVGYAPYMPLTLFAMFGGAFGALAGWRMVSTSGLAGWTTWLVGLAAVLVLTLVGAGAAAVVFPQAIPMLFWAGLAIQALAALAGITFFTRWAA